MVCRLAMFAAAPNAAHAALPSCKTAPCSQSRNATVRIGKRACGVLSSHICWLPPLAPAGFRVPRLHGCVSCIHSWMPPHTRCSRLLAAADPQVCTREGVAARCASAVFPPLRLRYFFPLCLLLCLSSPGWQVRERGGVAVRQVPALGARGGLRAQCRPSGTGGIRCGGCTGLDLAAGLWGCTG